MSPLPSVSPPARPWEEREDSVIGVTFIDGQGTVYGFPYTGLVHVIANGASVVLTIGGVAVTISFSSPSGGTQALELLESFTEQRVRRVMHDSDEENPVEVRVEFPEPEAA